MAAMPKKSRAGSEAPAEQEQAPTASDQTDQTVGEPEATVEQAATDESATKRGTRSFTPERDYQTVALVGVTVHNSIEVTDEQMASLEARMAEAASNLLGEILPGAEIRNIDQSKRWSRVQGDTTASFKAPKSKETTSTRLDAMFETKVDINALMASARTHHANGLSKKDAVLKAAEEMKLSLDDLKSVGIVVKKVEEAKAEEAKAEATA